MWVLFAQREEFSMVEQKADQKAMFGYDLPSASAAE